MIRTPRVILAMMVLRGMAQAATLTWTGAEDSSWQNPNNWSSGVVPVAEDILYFGQTDQYLVNRNATTRPNQLIFSRDAGSYTFTGNTVDLTGTVPTVPTLVNYSYSTQVFDNGVGFYTANSVIDTARGDIVINGGIHGGNNRVPIKDGIGTLTINGSSNVTLAVRIYAGTLVLDEYAGSYGSTTITFSPKNNSGLVIKGPSSGSVLIEKTNLTLNAANTTGGPSGQAFFIRLDANGGDGVHLAFTGTFSPLSYNTGNTFHVDLSTSEGNRLTFASVTNNGALSSSGILPWATVKDGSGIGFATYSDVDFVRNAALIEFNGGSATTSSSNYYLDGSTVATANRALGSLTLKGEAGGSITGSGAITTGGILLEEGTGDYTVSNHVYTTSSGRLYIHQYSEDGRLVFTGTVQNSETSGFLAKAGPGTVEIASTGVVTHQSNTYIQGGRFVVNGVVQQSAEIRVFDKATLEGGGSIGTLKPSSVRIFGGGTLAGTSHEALDITGTVTFDAYSHFAFTLDYTGSDFLSVSESITIDADVNLKLALAGNVELNDSILLMESGLISGQFTSVNGTDVDAEGYFLMEHGEITYRFRLDYSATEVRLIAVAAIPEPSAVLLAAGAVACLLVRRSRWS